MIRKNSRASRDTFVHLALPALYEYDAIGNDVLGMYRCLKSAGYHVQIHVTHAAGSAARYARRLDPQDPCWNDPEALLIYHHSTGWSEGRELLSRTQNRVVVKYHNITPPRYFEPYHEGLATLCRDGIDMTRWLASLPTVNEYWCDSGFNADELVRYGISPQRCRILAPFHRIQTLLDITPDLSLYDQLEHRTVILFAGAVKPNKGHHRLMDAFALYRRRNPHAILLLAGAMDPRLTPYYDELRSHAAFLGIADSVVLTGEISNHQLRTCFQMATLFVCASEHEGFCVPLIESMAFRLPIVAAKHAAVPETVGEAGLLFDDGDPWVFAEAIDYLVESDDLAAQLARIGQNRFREVYREQVLRRRFLTMVQEVLH